MTAHLESDSLLDMPDFAVVNSPANQGGIRLVESVRAEIKNVSIFDNKGEAIHE
ncbi:MAG: hypothetical protein ACLGSH_18260 [Acidobacteriota bacterium]